MLKSTVVDPRYIGKQAPGVRLFRLVEDPGTFVYTGPGAYHCGLNCPLNVAETVNISNGTLLDVGRIEGSVPYSRRVLHTVPSCGNTWRRNS